MSVHVSDIWQVRKVLSNLAIEINNEILDYKQHSLMAPLSIFIINQLSVTNKLPGFLLGKSLLRYSDFESQSWYSIVSGGYFRIEQAKTKKVLLREFKIYNPVLKDNLLLFLKADLSSNYNSLASEIERIVRQYLSHNNFDFKHKCHIFRHLYASWACERGVPVDEISSNLGNSSETVRSHYLHKGIKSVSF